MNSRTGDGLLHPNIEDHLKFFWRPADRRQEGFVERQAVTIDTLSIASIT